MRALSSRPTAAAQVGEKKTKAATQDAAEALMGVLMTLAGTFVQSVQYTYEEKVMSGDISAPPWLLIGMEGLCASWLRRPSTLPDDTAPISPPPGAS